MILASSHAAVTTRSVNSSYQVYGRHGWLNSHTWLNIAYPFTGGTKSCVPAATHTSFHFGLHGRKLVLTPVLVWSVDMLIFKPICILSSDSYCCICFSSCGVSVHKNMSSAKRRWEINSPSIFTPLFSLFLLFHLYPWHGIAD